MTGFDPTGSWQLLAPHQPCSRLSHDRAGTEGSRSTSTSTSTKASHVQQGCRGLLAARSERLRVGLRDLLVDQLSNRHAQPPTYRAIIDKVIASVRPDFEDNGIEDAVLQALQEVSPSPLAFANWLGGPARSAALAGLCRPGC